MRTVIFYKTGPYLPITETWIYGQLKNLKRYQPIVYALKTENLNIYPTENVRSLELRRGLGDFRTFFNKGWNKLFNFYPGFLLTLRRDKPDLAHAHFGPSGYNFLPLKRLFGLPLITTFYGFDMSLLPHRDTRWRARYKKLFQQGDHFLAEGHYMKKGLVELGCPEEKVTVQHLGIDLDQIGFVPRELEENGEIRILIAASFREKKGIPYAIEAFGRVRQKHKNLYLTIIGDSTGTPKEEKEKQRILAIIDKHGLDRCVNMMGYQSYPVFLRELRKHHILLAPSVHASDGDTEGGAPVSIIEASASGMPIVSTTHCDIPEVVMDGRTGYLVPERDVDALAAKLEFLVSNPDLWEQMGQKGQEHIEENYNVITQAQRLERIYDSVVKGRSKVSG